MVPQRIGMKRLLNGTENRVRLSGFAAKVNRIAKEGDEDGNRYVKTIRRVQNYKQPPYHVDWFHYDTVDREHTHCMQSPGFTRVVMRNAPPRSSRKWFARKRQRRVLPRRPSRFLTMSEQTSKFHMPDARGPLLGVRVLGRLTPQFAKRTAEDRLSASADEPTTTNRRRRSQ